jgi:hypothetical protein
MTRGDSVRPIMEPRNMPEYTSAKERERSWEGTHLVGNTTA